MWNAIHRIVVTFLIILKQRASQQEVLGDEYNEIYNTFVNNFGNKYVSAKLMGLIRI